MPLRRLAFASALVLLALPSGPALADTPGPAFGLLLEAESAGSLPAPPDLPADHPLVARIVARWDEVETEKGVYDWSRIAPAVETLAAGRFRIVLCLTGSNPLYLPEGKAPSPIEGDSLAAWTAFVRSAVRSFAPGVAVFEIWDGPAAAFDPAIYGFVLKSSALAVRAEARAAGAEALVAEGAISASDLEWQKSLWLQDAAAYVDVLPVRVAAGSTEVSREVEAVFREAVRNPPAPAYWAYVEADGGGGSGAAAAAAVQAVSASLPASVALARIPEGAAALEREARLVYGLQRALAGFAPAPRGQVEFVGDDRVPLAGARALGRFLNDAEDDFPTRIVFDAPGTALAAQQGWLVVDAPDLRSATVLDPLQGGSIASVPSKVPSRPDRRAVKVVFAAHPMVVEFRRAPLPEDLTLPKEDLEVRSVRGLTAEEIIARHQAVQKIQDDRLERWIASGRVDYHFKIAQAGSTVDVAIDSGWLWERGADLEWEQRTYYVNGARVKWKSMPEIPYVQPEKVVVLPLDLTLDRTYVYRLRGEDEVAGRAAYVLEFEPASADASASLYRGRIWVDRETFVRLRTSLIQTNLEPPVVSNEETDAYAPVEGPDGERYWLLSRIDGQQLWTVGGRNLVVHREIGFESYEINPSKQALGEARERAYASTHLMMRDTDEGYRYLERQPDGSRTVKMEQKTRLWFAAAGAFKDSARSNAVPLAGANYLDYDLFKQDIQLNVLFAGAVAFVNLSNPGVLGGRADLTVEGAGIAVKGEDRVYEGDDEVLVERIEDRTQYLSGRLGVPLGSFGKLSLVADLYSTQYFGNGDAEAALASYNEASGTDLRFVLPPNQQTFAGTVQLEVNRRGYTATASGTWSRRSDWAPWGLYDAAAGEFLGGSYDAGQKSYAKWGVAAFKEFYLPKFQKLRFEADYMDGARLDRFSQYQFSLFGQDRLSGFAGTGVRFDRGMMARAGYSFNIADLIRLDLAWDSARVRDEGDAIGWRTFGGAGISGNVVGPWKTVISASYGRAIVSDIPDLEGSQEFLLMVLKLF